MVTEVAENIYRIGIPLPENPLRELNSYFVRGAQGKRNLLVDTGFRRPECREVLLDGLAQLRALPEETDLFITHFHADHMGLAEEICGQSSRVYVEEHDLAYLKRIVAPGGRYDRACRFEAEGFPSAALERFYATDPAMKMNVTRVTERFAAVRDGDTLDAGGCAARVLWMPGHTPGNAMLWLQERKIMFTGDHVLFDISPNITFWETSPDALGDYLQSLKKAEKYPVALALPGHRGSGEYQARIGELLEHHARRMEEIGRILCERPGLTAYETAGAMRWRIRADSWEAFPLSQKWFAMGECLAHLDHMCALGLAVRREIGGVRRYYACGEQAAE